MIHALTCPIRRRWLRKRDHIPFWRDDKVAQMLGIAWYGCHRCGRGAVEQRDADPMRDTCPTSCVERNHPGREHDAWVSGFSLPPETRCCTSHHFEGCTDGGPGCCARCPINPTDDEGASA